MEKGRLKLGNLFDLFAVFHYWFVKIWSLSHDCEKCLATLSPLESNNHLQPRLQFDGQTIACASETGILLWDFKTLQMTRYVSETESQSFFDVRPRFSRKRLGSNLRIKLSMLEKVEIVIDSHSNLVDRCSGNRSFRLIASSPNVSSRRSSGWKVEKRCAYFSFFQLTERTNTTL